MAWCWSRAYPVPYNGDPHPGKMSDECDLNLEMDTTNLLALLDFTDIEPFPRSSKVEMLIKNDFSIENPENSTKKKTADANEGLPMRSGEHLCSPENCDDGFTLSTKDQHGDLPVQTSPQVIKKVMEIPNAATKFLAYISVNRKTSVKEAIPKNEIQNES